MPNGPFMRMVAPAALGALAMSLVIAAFWKDLGLNLVADAISILFAIYILERIRERSEKERLQKVYMAMYLSGMSVKSKIFKFVEYLSLSVLKNEDAPALVSAAKGDATKFIALMRGVSYHSQVDYWPAAISESGYDPDRRWGDFSRDQIAIIAHKAETFLSQYAMYSEPALVEALSEFKPADGGMYDAIGKPPLHHLLDVEWDRLLKADRTLGAELEKLWVLAQIDPKSHILPPSTLNLFPYLLKNLTVLLASRGMFKDSPLKPRTARRPFFPGRYASDRGA